MHRAVPPFCRSPFLRHSAELSTGRTSLVVRYVGVIALMLTKCNAWPSGLCEYIVNAVPSQLDQCVCFVSAVCGRLDHVYVLQ